MEIWSTQIGVAQEAMAKAGVQAGEVAAIGIANQRETTIVWDRETGQPVYNAVVWQDRRTAGECDRLRAAGAEAMVRAKTGLLLDPYFSATKVRWILDNVPGASGRAERGELAFGTVDSWLVYRLTEGRVHVTDVTNASRTLLCGIGDLEWDDELLDLFRIPASLLPTIVDSSGVVGETSAGLFGAAVPIAGVAGDQQAALFGQACHAPGMAKNTYGTGCFVLLNTGDEAARSQSRLLTTPAWRARGRTAYALEGSVFVAGAVVQWLRDGLGIIRDTSEIEPLARSVPDNGGVFLVPAFVGLGAPYWDSNARGSVFGLTRGVTAGHLARAALESIAFQTSDVLSAMERDSGIPPRELRVDGGAARNDLLMQFQADILGIPVVRPVVTEATALGAAYLAGLAVGFWASPSEISQNWQEDKRYEPSMSAETRAGLLARWHDAVSRSGGWCSPGG